MSRAQPLAALDMRELDELRMAVLRRRIKELIYLAHEIAERHGCTTPQIAAPRSIPKRRNRRAA